MSSNTLLLSAVLSKDKFSTNSLLRRFGFPVCEQIRVTNINSFESACQKIGFPLVVKPNDQDGGVGISSNLTDIESAKEAFCLASKVSKNVLVETYVNGDDIRIIFFEGRLLKCFKRKKQGVVGDGRQSIRALVDQKNALARKKNMRLEMNDVTKKLLERQGFSLQSIPAQGVYIKLGELHNVSAGGIMLPLSAEDIHPDNIDLAKKAVQILRLDFGGVDLITDDIKKSWRETNLAITEINSAPQIGSEDKAVFDVIIDMLSQNISAPAVHCIVTVDVDETKKLASKNNLIRGTAVVFNGQVATPEEMLVKQFQNTFIAARAAAQQLGIIKVLLYMTIEEVEAMGLPFLNFNQIVLSDAVRLSKKFNLMAQFVADFVVEKKVYL